MKKLFIASFILMTFALRIEAQVGEKVNLIDKAAAPVNKTADKKVPALVLQAMKVHFSLNNPQTWTKFPYSLSDYGWINNQSTNSQPEHFEVKMTTPAGDKLSAIYTSDGKLLKTNEIFLNVTLPSSVVAKLSNSQYKNWTMIGNRVIIHYDHSKNSVDQSYRVVLAKGTTERTISINFQTDAKRLARYGSVADESVKSDMLTVEALK
jgi:hypothetical protein